MTCSRPLRAPGAAPTTCRAQAQLVVLAEDCNQVDYKTLVEALCAEKGIDLLSVKEAKQLGQWAGVRSPTLVV